MLRLFLAVVLAIGLSGCAHRRPAELSGCRIDAYPMLVGGHHPRAADGTAAEGVARDTGFFDLQRIEQPRADRPVPPAPFQRAITSALARGGRDLAARDDGIANAVLVLSGGGQHGPFGTGFYLGLGPIPRYRVVTGVSTGSLQTTFLFLGRPTLPDPASIPKADQRVYPKDRGDLDIPPGSSDVGDLALASSISSERSLLRVNPLGLPGGLLAGSISSLGPLEDRLYGMISRETLRAVAAERAKGRLLYVGVADLDDGNGYALDLTALAAQGAAAGTDAGIDAARHCYARALIASSSVPLAAFPVSLALHDSEDGAADAAKHHLVIDGGARFGVFFRQIVDAARTAATPAKPVDVDLIVNGSLYTTPWLDKAGKPVDRWSVLTLGERSLDILENQVYRFSVEQVESSTAGGRLRMAFISNENLPPGSVEPDDFAYRGQTCGQWSARDEHDYHVLQFHPRYMACLLAYGRDRGSRGEWNIDTSRRTAAR